LNETEIGVVRQSLQAARKLAATEGTRRAASRWSSSKTGPG
jgi:hypothetical protein